MALDATGGTCMTISFMFEAVAMKATSALRGSSLAICSVLYMFITLRLSTKHSPLSSSLLDHSLTWRIHAHHSFLRRLPRPQITDGTSRLLREGLGSSRDVAGSGLLSSGAFTDVRSGHCKYEIVPKRACPRRSRHSSSGKLII